MLQLDRSSRDTRPSDGRGLGPLGGLGRWAATHRRTVLLAWVVVAVVLGVLAPRAEHALSGGGWQADGSESVEARRLIDRHFDGQGSYALLAVVSSHAGQREPGLPRDGGPRGGPAAARPGGRSRAVGRDRAGRGGGRRARRRGRRHRRDGARRESPARTARGGGRTGHRARVARCGLIAPGWYGVANVKWLTRIEVMDQRWAGRFMARDYVTIREPHRGQAVWTFNTVKHDLLSRRPAKVTRHRDRYAVMGAAWGAPIAEVEVQIDGGAWRAAQLDDRRRARKRDGFAWRFWTSTGAGPARVSTRSGHAPTTSRATSSRHRTTRSWPARSRTGRATARSPAGAHPRSLSRRRLGVGKTGADAPWRCEAPGRGPRSAESGRFPSVRRGGRSRGLLVGEPEMGRRTTRARR